MGLGCCIDGLINTKSLDWWVNKNLEKGAAW